MCSRPSLRLPCDSGGSRWVEGTWGPSRSELQGARATLVFYACRVGVRVFFCCARPRRLPGSKTRRRHSECVPRGNTTGSSADYESSGSTARTTGRTTTPFARANVAGDAASAQTAYCNDLCQLMVNVTTTPPPAAPSRRSSSRSAPTDAKPAVPTSWATYHTDLCQSIAVQSTGCTGVEKRA